MNASDLVHAARRLRKSPGFAAAAVGALALGVGVSSAVFSIVNGVLLRPLPFPEPDRLVMITREGDVSLPDGRDWRPAAPAFESMALFLRSWSLDLTGDGEPMRIAAAVVEPEYFRVLGATPQLGRVLVDEDDRTGAPHVAVLSHALWQSRFAGDRGVLGRSLVLSDEPATVVGVMGSEFDLFGDEADLWIAPAAATPFFAQERGSNNFDAIGRLKPDATLARAQAELLAVSRTLEAQYPRTNRGKLVVPIGLADFLTGDVRPVLLALLGAVLVVIAVSGANLASLLLARSAARREELAIRMALGAGRGRLLTQVLAEGLLLAVLGGGLGLFCAWATQDALLALAPADLPRQQAIAIDGRVFAFGATASLLLGLVFSAVPALQVIGSDPAAALQGAGRGVRPVEHRALGLVVVAEVALAFVLLAGGGLLLQSFRALSGVPLGFEPRGTLGGEFSLPRSRYGEDREKQTRTVAAMVAEARALPGVTDAAYTIAAPLDRRGGLGGTVLFQEPPPLRPAAGTGARVRLLHGDYFGTMGMRMVEGRAFDANDRAGSEPVAIVNERFARQFWGERSPLGARVAYRDFHDGTPFFMTVVGVVADVKGITLGAPDFRTIYTPYEQRRVDWQAWGNLVVRTAGDPEALRRGLQEAVWRVDPQLPLARVYTLADRVAEHSARERFSALLVLLFAGVGLVVAVQGVYAVLAFLLEERRRELGVRLALGARAMDLARIVAGQGAALAVAGICLGAPLAVAAGWAATHVLFGVTWQEPGAYAAAALSLLAVALVATAAPALRASRLDPVRALRSE